MCERAVFGLMTRPTAKTPSSRGTRTSPVVALTRYYERVSRHPRIRAEQWQRLAEDKAFSIDAAVRDLGYAPRSFSDGIRAEAAALGLAPPSSSSSRPSTPLRPSAPLWRNHA